MEAVIYTILGFIVIIAIGAFSRQKEAADYWRSSPPSLPSLDNLSRDKIEDLWISNKLHIFHCTRNPSKHSGSYENKLLAQDRQLEIILFEAHRLYFTLDVDDDSIECNCGKILESNQLILLKDINLHSIQPEIVAALVFLSYSELPLKNGNFIRNSPRDIIRYTNHLFDMGYQPAQLLKGLVLKYGFYPLQRPFPIDAEKWLALASKSGINEANLELKNIQAYHILDDIQDGFGDSYRTKWD